MFLPDAALPDGVYRFIALDVETANRDAASISQIGLACVRRDGGIETFSTYINPDQDFAAFNTELTGIDAGTVRNAPTFAEAWPMMLPLLSRNLMVQHSNFDQTAITAACRAAGLNGPKMEWADSVKIARKAWPEFRGNGGHGLGHLKKALGLEFHHHDAGEDARAAAEVVLLAEERLKCPVEDITGKIKHLQLTFEF
ncbi:3'-5' exonuclease [uncultured Shimia sp.]|uniref:3'-5' exonuclease n=1 Tax=uncultured Shimia sp. TaxID=573152 RepID=UPI0025D23C8C|nr:3'-5' exonuclease [uncultured Shimia sp.]